MKNHLTLLLCIIVSTTLSAQPLTKHWVQFKDKVDNPFSVDKPEEFLSKRAIERRTKHNIKITEQDLPVNPQYIQKLKELGATVYTTSKWFNAATVHASDEVLAKIKELKFVKNTEPVGRYYKKRPNRTKKKRDHRKNYYKVDEHYGFGKKQISSLNGDLIHRMGHDGNGIMVAVLDGGFSNVDIMPFFDSLRADNRMLQGKDLVDNDNNVYQSSSHGSHVLSTMAANLPGMFIGTGPGATYVCVKTEDVRSELRIEEDNFVAGLEYADSLGVDLVNSSLGYTTFNIKSMSHSYKDMNGKTSRASIGTDIASEKGMLIVVSAGNEGNGRWKYIGAPADAKHALSVGALDRNDKRVSFSSQGPTVDGRVKPNVMARGRQTVVGSLYSYQVDSSDGTSFAAPVLAGMAASLWSAFPEKSNFEIKQAIEQSADRYENPDGKYGNGLPDFYKAYRILAGEEKLKEDKERPGIVKRGFVEALQLIKGKGEGKTKVIKP
jgi:subtilisin family serine protease